MEADPIITSPTAIATSTEGLIEYLQQAKEWTEEEKIQNYPKICAKIIHLRDIDQFGIFISNMTPEFQNKNVVREVLRNLSLDVLRVLGVGSKEFLVSILSFTVDLFLPYRQDFYNELFKFRLKLSDTYVSVGDLPNATETLQGVISDFTAEEPVVVDRVKAYLKLAECAIADGDIDTAATALVRVEALADGGVHAQRMSVRPSVRGSVGERTFHQVYQMCMARLECLRGDFGYASHLFWQLALQHGADAPECQASAVLCAVLTPPGEEQRAQWETLKPSLDTLEGVGTLKKIVEGCSVTKEDLEGFSENILPMFHARKESGLSFFHEVILQHQLGVATKKGVEVTATDLAGLLSEVSEEQVLEYVGELVTGGKVDAIIDGRSIKFNTNSIIHQ